MSASLGWLVIWGTPIFIMVSGYLLIKPSPSQNIKEFINKRASKILIPLVFWNIFYYLINHNFTNLSITEFFYLFFHQQIQSHLYFLNIIFGLYLITPLISKNINKLQLSIVVPLLICFSSLYHYSYCFLNFPKITSPLLIFIPYIGYYLAGYWIKTWPKIKYSKLTNILVTFIFLSSIFITRKLVFIFTTHDQDTILVSNLSLPVAAMTIIIFSKLILISNKYLIKYKSLPKFANLTLGVYLIHPFYLFLLKTIPVYSYLQTNYFWLWFFGLFATTTTLSFITIYLLKKIPILNRVV